MSQEAQAELILKLYELRREATMREARNWFFRDFNPQSKADIDKELFGPHSGHMRMVWSYWDMAAALVNHGAISIDLFNETNGEWVSIYAKIEPFLEELRVMLGPNFLMNLEKLVEATPGGRKRMSDQRERMQKIRAMAAQQAKA